LKVNTTGTVGGYDRRIPSAVPVGGYDATYKNNGEKPRTRFSGARLFVAGALYFLYNDVGK
jgi:hypothetical protein